MITMGDIGSEFGYHISYPQVEEKSSTYRRLCLNKQTYGITTLMSDELATYTMGMHKVLSTAILD